MLLLLCDIIRTDGSWRKKESTKRREEPLDTSFEYSSSSFSARLRDPLLITFLLATKGGDFSRCCCCCCIFWHSVLFLHFFSLLCIVSACASSTLADCTAPTFDSFCYLPYHQFENHLEETTTRRRNKRGRRARQQRRRNDNNKKERDRERPREGSAGLHLLSTLTRYDDPLWLCAVCVCVCIYRLRSSSCFVEDFRLWSISASVPCSVSATGWLTADWKACSVCCVDSPDFPASELLSLPSIFWCPTRFTPDCITRHCRTISTAMYTHPAAAGERQSLSPLSRRRWMDGRRRTHRKEDTATAKIPSASLPAADFWNDSQPPQKRSNIRSSSFLPSFLPPFVVHVRIDAGIICISHCILLL